MPLMILDLKLGYTLNLTFFKFMLLMIFYFQIYSQAFWETS